MTNALWDDFKARSATDHDIRAHLPTLAALAMELSSERPAVLAEFGTRTGNSTAAFLAGLSRSEFGGTLHSYDINEPQFSPAGESPLVRWQFHRSDTAKLGHFPHVNLLFIDTLHTAEQVAAELEHAPKVSDYLVFHDTVLFGSVDEGTGAQIGINHAIFSWLAGHEGRKWTVHSHSHESNGLLILERR